MLLKIKNCLPNQYAHDSDRQHALENLIMSSAFRHNIIILDTKTIESILICDMYNTNIKNYTHDIRSYRREYAGIANTLSTHAIVDFNYEGDICAFEKGKPIIKVSYKYFIDPKNLGPITLLTENLEDFKLYNIITEYYSHSISDHKLNFSFDFSLGGGSQIKTMFDNIKNAKKLVLCIVDSDKYHPNMAEGSTSSPFSKEDRENIDGSLAYIIDMREIETLIPTNIIQKIAIEKKLDEQIESLDDITTFTSIEGQFRKFFDHKKGLTLKEAIHIDNTYSSFWLDILAKKTIFSSKSCLQDKECYGCNSCPKIIGFGDKILKHSIEKMQQSNLRRLSVDQDIINDWITIGEIMIGWGCVPAGQRSRSS